MLSVTKKLSLILNDKFGFDFVERRNFKLESFSDHIYESVKVPQSKWDFWFKHLDSGAAKFLKILDIQIYESM